MGRCQAKCVDFNKVRNLVPDLLRASPCGCSRALWPRSLRHVRFVFEDETMSIVPLHDHEHHKGSLHRLRAEHFKFFASDGGLPQASTRCRTLVPESLAARPETGGWMIHTRALSFVQV